MSSIGMFDSLSTWHSFIGADVSCEVAPFKLYPHQEMTGTLKEIHDLIQLNYFSGSLKYDDHGRLSTTDLSIIRRNGYGVKFYGNGPPGGQIIHWCLINWVVF